MAKHNMFQTKVPPKPSSLPTHPVWRGIGCILIIVIPLISYLIASSLINNRNEIPWLIIPNDLLVFRIKDVFLLIKILYAGLLVIIFGIIIAALTFILNRIFGPSRYGPLDIPPDQVTKRR